MKKRNKILRSFIPFGAVCARIVSTRVIFSLHEECYDGFVSCGTIRRRMKKISITSETNSPNEIQTLSKRSDPNRLSRAAIVGERRRRNYYHPVLFIKTILVLFKCEHAAAHTGNKIKLQFKLLNMCTLIVQTKVTSRACIV